MIFEISHSGEPSGPLSRLLTLGISPPLDASGERDLICTSPPRASIETGFKRKAFSITDINAGTVQHQSESAQQTVRPEATEITAV